MGHDEGTEQGTLFESPEGVVVDDDQLAAGLADADAMDIEADNERDFDADIVLGPNAERHRYAMVPREPFPVRGAVLIARGTVLGGAATAGSKVSGAAGRWSKGPDGKPKFIPSLNERGIPKTFTKDSSGAKGDNWRSDVRDAVIPLVKAIGVATPLDVPLALEVVFFRARTKGHYGTGRNAALLKDSAPLYPGTKPDAIKLMRAFEDALNEIIWKDDSRNIDVLSRKRFTNGPPRAQWRLWRMPETVADARVLAG